ncbi:GNAT family N-acetyltransferase [Scleromatobacter humisilvae]|uniref:GNAT family N-acetyltransferase n=1 Tax=Scleromatobacter humisilvae TaxID=2897159 RepID=A0A9X2C1U8_9BURK|nr:GNAT family N-acetyltransferase [Scleromatobacter humisilvae]MCK9688577.1 GNAT family N-acetyltransferase [Scleromatobacter humisilvae]
MAEAPLHQMTLRPADPADWPAIAALTQGCCPRTTDVPERLETWLLGEAGAEVVGAVELEPVGDIGFLRCVAVDRRHRSAGLGKELAAAVESFARSKGMNELCLLTTAAVPFFAARGYRVDNRADAPAAVQATPAFQAGNPDTAVFMTLRLDGRANHAAHIRSATGEDANAILDIYGPIVRHTALSSETEPPSVDEMRARIERALPELPWLVSHDERGTVSGYAFASRHRERAAYRWTVDTSICVRQGCREQGIGRRLGDELLKQLVQRGYRQAFARVVLPNEASIRLHRALGFESVGVFKSAAFKNGAWRDVSWWQRQLQDLPPQPAEPVPSPQAGPAAPNTRPAGA